LRCGRCASFWIDRGRCPRHAVICDGKTVPLFERDFRVWVIPSNIAEEAQVDCGGAGAGPQVLGPRSGFGNDRYWSVLTSLLTICRHTQLHSHHD
jgi:hypothetical protein